MPLHLEIEASFREMCQEALAEPLESDLPAQLFILAAPGKSFRDGAIIITLNKKAAALFRQIVVMLRSDRDLRAKASVREIQNEVKAALFDGTQALEDGNFDAPAITEALVERLNSQQPTWEVYLPIDSIQFPGDESIQLAGGIFKKLSEEDKGMLGEERANQLTCSKWPSEEKRISGVRTRVRDFDEIMDSSTYWFVYQANGRPESAESTAREAATLGVDLLLFWGLLNGIDPETSLIAFSSREAGTRSFQLVKRQEFVLDYKAPAAFPYRLAGHAFERLLGLPEFITTQTMSSDPNPTELGQKFLLAIQQFAEATRLPTATLKLVWYLSAMETLLAAEDEGSRHLKVKRRVKSLLGEGPSDLIGPLYDKRRRPVHYGHRNRVGEELITEDDLQAARTLSYLAIVSGLGRLEGLTWHKDFLRLVNSR